MIHHDEAWVQIASLDNQNQITFTDEFLEIMGELGWEAKAFAGHLLGLWYDPFEHMLDYSSGEARFTADHWGSTLPEMAVRLVVISGRCGHQTCKK